MNILENFVQWFRVYSAPNDGRKFESLWWISEESKVDRQISIVWNEKLPNLIRVPLVRQSTNYTCGVAALQSVLAFYGHSMREDILAHVLESGPDHGTNYHQMVEYVRALGFSADAVIALDLDGLRALLDAGTPVILAIQAWSDNPARYASDWEDGHYVVAVGYDDKRVYFMDPSTLGHYTVHYEH